MDTSYQFKLERVFCIYNFHGGSVATPKKCREMTKTAALCIFGEICNRLCRLSRLGLPSSPALAARNTLPRLAGLINPAESRCSMRVKNALHTII